MSICVQFSYIMTTKNLSMLFSSEMSKCMSLQTMHLELDLAPGLVTITLVFEDTCEKGKTFS